MTRFYLVFIVTIFMLYSENVFCMTLDSFIRTYKLQIIEDVALFDQEELVITADDGTKVILNRLNNAYEKNVRFINKYLNGVDNENECYYLLTCEHKDNILLVFDEEKNYFQKFKENLFVDIHYKYDTMMFYKFNYIYDADLMTNRDIIFWIDKENKKYCGSFLFPYLNFEDNYEDCEDGERYYNFLKDICVEYAKNEIIRCNNLLENDIDFQLDITAFQVCQPLLFYGKEQWDSLLTELNKLYLEENRSVKLLARNQNRISGYINSVSMFQRFYKSLSSDMFRPHGDTRPNISGELPINDEELSEYLAWQMKGYIEGFIMIDIYDTPVKFEIVSEGLKVLSAGRDKVWDTEDDQYLIRTYESVGMKPLN